jgi:TPR repeat protein
MRTNMLRNLLCAVMLLHAGAVAAGSDIWASLFRETLQQARNGDSEAQYNVGALYQNGRGVKADRDKAIEWYTRAADQGNSKAVSRLGLMEANRSSFNSEMQQAENGSAESQYNVGNMFTKGNGTGIDLEQALSWYEKAANQRHIKAAYKLGLAHYEGAGVRKNGKQALKWFSLAADDGYAPAQYYLGKLHAEGNGVRRDYSTALEWFTRAVDGGFDQARGEMIDVTERMQMQAAGSKPSQPKAEAAVAAKPEPAAAGKRPAAAASRKTAVTADAGTPEEPPVAGDASGISTMEDLMLGNWSRNEQPVAWLPSSINNCRTEQNRIVCFSGDQVRESGNNTVKFKTKAIISHFSAAGAFNVTYRNLVLSAVSKEPASIGEVAAFDEALEEKGYTVRTGWGKEHTLECLMSDSHAVNCTKNKIQALALVNQQQVAGSR